MISKQRKHEDASKKHKVKIPNYYFLDNLNRTLQNKDFMKIIV